MSILVLKIGFFFLFLFITVWLSLMVVARYKTKLLMASLFEYRSIPEKIDYGECPPGDYYGCGDVGGFGDCDCPGGGIEYSDEYLDKLKIAKAKYIGKCRIPSRVYVGDSINVIIDLRLSIRPSTGKASSMKYHKGKDDLHLQISCRRMDVENLEFEFIAAGFQIEGEKKQRQRLNSDRLQYQWNCFFPNSGQHHFSIVGRLIGQTHKEEVGRIEDSLRVVKVDHMTQRQVWVLTTIAGVISGILSIAITLQTLGF